LGNNLTTSSCFIAPNGFCQLIAW